MATAIFYNFTKRKNSTKTPTGGTSYDVNLKSGTSLLSPTLLLNINSRPTYNYLSFEGRFYYVTDIVSVRNDLWEITCSVDALGSWKSAIGNSEANILYATGGRNNIVDARIPVTSDVHVNVENGSLTGDFTGFTWSTMGICILSITGTGSFGSYLMEAAADIPNLMRNISVWGATSMIDVTTALQQFVYGGGAAQCLKNALCLPIILSSMGNFGAREQLYLGDYPCADANGNGIFGYPVENPFLSASCTVNIPWAFSDWRRNNPYTKVYMYLPLIGMLSIPSTEIVNESAISVYYSLNVLSGDVAVQIKGSDSHRKLATASANIAMSTPYGSANISGAKITSAIGVGVASVAAVALGVATGGAGVLALGGGLSASAKGLLEALGGETAGGGGLGGSAVTGLDLGISCYCVYKDLTDTQANLDPIIGKPVMKKHTIASANGNSNFSGFVQTDGMCVNGDMTDSEYDIINAACDRGIYYE